LVKSQNRANTRFFKHTNAEDLAHILHQYSKETGKLVVTDGVFSMEGDIAPLPELIKKCREEDAQLFVDDAHGIGVLGQGHGTSAYFGCQDDVDLIGGTFSKSFGSMGGFIAGSKEVIHWIEHRARSYMFSASLSPANVAAVIAAIDIMKSEPERIERVNKIAETMRNELVNLGYDLGNSETPIVPVIIGDPFKTMQVWERLIKGGIYTNVALPPAVPASGCLLRTSYMSIHTDSQLDKILSVFSDLKKKFDITKSIRESTNNTNPITANSENSQNKH
jgi:7-keto-8-aminopelargonate synthetase-like enzyme